MWSNNIVTIAAIRKPVDDKNSPPSIKISLPADSKWAAGGAGPLNAGRL
jgi:hypothetical protein